jgi:hypothetical protein
VSVAGKRKYRSINHGEESEEREEGEVEDQKAKVGKKSRPCSQEKKSRPCSQEEARRGQEELREKGEAKGQGCYEGRTRPGTLLQSVLLPAQRPQRRPARARRWPGRLNPKELPDWSHLGEVCVSRVRLCLGNYRKICRFTDNCDIKFVVHS